MSIVVVCPNGHRLAARDNRAGTVGRCPACGAEVKIPAQKNKPPSDSSILRILGVGEELRRRLADNDGATFDSEMLDEPKKKATTPAKKICPRCDWEIDAGYKICPKCRFYFMQ